MGRRPELSTVTRGWADAHRPSLAPGDSKLILIELAVATADLADRAREDADSGRFLSAASRLQQLILAVERNRDDRGGDGSGGDAWSRELADVLGSGPTLGDVA